MVKIKQKKTMSLPQLIEWAMYPGSNVLFEVFTSENMTVKFDEFGNPHIESKMHYLPANEKFDVEVEEEITEDTKFSHIVFIDDCDLSASYENKSINEIKYGHDKEFHAYINGEFKLIWTCEKGLVE